VIKVGIVGCGKIADQHVGAIQRLGHCKIVGVCDTEDLMARQLAERFQIKRFFKDIRNFLNGINPDVVHITTPPQSHLDLGLQCLEAGCHVYMEKPFALNAQETEVLIEKAVQRGRKITVGHNAQFSLAARRMRELVATGYLGGRPIHLECYYGYHLGDPQYAKALLGDKDHWVRKLPGRLLHNIINHGIAKLAEFLSGDSLRIIAHGFASRTLKEIGEFDLIDELRAVIRGHNDTTAYFTFSTQMRPVLHQLRLYGTKNGLIMDDDHQTLIKLPGAKYKSYLDQFIPPFHLAKQYFKNSSRNILDFFKWDLHVNGGMMYLVEAFYKSIQEDGPPPIPYSEIILTSKIMDLIFEQIYQD
jgi:predicted dehydrogenase